MNNYRGCVEKNGKYLDLQGKTAVFIDTDWKASLLKPDNAVLILFYLSDEHLYVVQPLRPMTVCLPSGQPLGINKQYFLPRGSQITLNNHAEQIACLL